MAKKRIVVMYGGKADEHSISCISTAGVLGAMDTERFEPIPVGITKDGKWIVNGENPLGWSLDEGLPTVEKTPGAKDVVLEVALGQDGFFARDTTHSQYRSSVYKSHLKVRSYLQSRCCGKLILR